ncbi:nitroreductase family protein [Paenibacillus thailandensis]|uniref:Nitroreductase family protein n=1 Tax=Paenibacillus thailandensis TaxID=393250 RepID=A0ABW5R6L1_9BACL
MEFSELVKERRSASKFLTDVSITEDELNEIFNEVKYAPSAFNLQHAHYLVVQDPELKAEVFEAAGKQYKVKSASAAILVLGDTEAYKSAPEINEGLLHLGIMSKQEYDHANLDVKAFYESRGDVFKREEAIRNASLSAMLFMLVAKDRGWDTCPMIGFDPRRIVESLEIPDRYVPALLVTIGKEDRGSRRPRGYRKPVSEFVSYNRIRR